MLTNITLCFVQLSINHNANQKSEMAIYIGALGMGRRKIAFESYFIGQATNEILPTGSGELARLSILKKYTNRSLVWFGPSVILERLYDMLLLLILSIFLPTPRKPVLQY